MNLCSPCEFYTVDNNDDKNRDDNTQGSLNNQTFYCNKNFNQNNEFYFLNDLIKINILSNNSVQL